MRFFVSFVFLLLAYEIQASVNRVENNVIVSTKLGDVKGSLMNSRSGKRIYAFRGIHYALPPTGELRFKPPVPAKPWDGVFDASKEGPACPQDLGMGLTEDCLTLDIYTKQIPKANNQPLEKLPVIVYLFWGAFKLGSPQTFVTGPKYLLEHDIVLVMVNYRLASLGFLNTGDEYAPGNMGLKDQVMALRFIRDEIEAFGGDPNSVTLTGQSAGSRSIALHLISPMSKGLFHRAIALSGAMTTMIPPQREQVDLAIKQAGFLNCTTNSRDEMFKCLREKPAEDYGRSYHLFSEWYDSPILTWYPSIEPEIPGVERFLSLEPEELMRLGQINEVPVIFGVTEEEYSYKAQMGIDEALKGDHTFFQELNKRWYELAPICFMYERDTNRSRYISEKLAEFYFNNEPITLYNSDSLGRLFGNAIGHFPVYKTVSLLSKHSSAPVYFYKFTYPGRYSHLVSSETHKPIGRVIHGDDLIYLFDTEYDIYSALKTVPDIVMVNRLTSMWAHFAKTGEPLPKDPELFGHVTWDRYTPEGERYLNIGKNLTMESHFLPKTMKFWSSLFP